MEKTLTRNTDGLVGLLEQHDRQFGARSMLLSPKQSLIDGDSATIYKIKSGSVISCFRHESGKCLGLEVHGSGEIIGLPMLMGIAVPEYFACAVDKNTRVNGYPISAARLMIDDPAGYLDIARRLAEASGRVLNKISRLASLKIKSRLAWELVSLTGKFGLPHPEGTLIGLRVTHWILAWLAGAARENISGTLERFQREGVVRLGRYEIVVKNLPRLREAAHWE